MPLLGLESIAVAQVVAFQTQYFMGEGVRGHARRRPFAPKRSGVQVKSNRLPPFTGTHAQREADDGKRQAPTTWPTAMSSHPGSSDVYGHGQRDAHDRPKAGQIGIQSAYA